MKKKICRREIILSALFFLALLFVLDGYLSYRAAAEEFDRINGPNKRYYGCSFAGVWSFSFRYDGAHKNSSVTYEVMPVTHAITTKIFSK